MLTDREVRDLAETMLAHALGPSGFESADVRSGLDEDGEPSLFVAIRFRPGSGVTSGRVASEAMTAFREALEARGENRFPYLGFKYVGEDTPFDNEEIDMAAP